jgi:8-hydroxy-5-deazaflavin:NADPH oxidoreductase
MAFGSMPAGLFESAGNRSPEPAVLFYAADDDRAGQEVERLIRMAGFEPVKIGGIEQSAGSRWAATFTSSWSAPPRRGH